VDTEAASPGGFTAATASRHAVGSDFLEKATGNMVELTTPGQVGAHVARGGDYVNALYATYRFGRMLTE
jgi:hypothetical protein